MTGYLNYFLKIGNVVHIKVDCTMKDCYFPSYLHDQIGTIWNLDEKHIWIKVARKDIEGKSYISGPDRYCWMDITLELISQA